MITVNNQIQLHSDICSYISHVINLLTTNLTYDNDKIISYIFHAFSVHILKLCQSLYYIIGPKTSQVTAICYKPSAGRRTPDFLKLILCGLSVCVFVCVSAPKAINN